MKGDKKSSEVLLREAVRCLYLELPESVADDVSAKADAVLAKLTELRKALTGIKAKLPTGAAGTGLTDNIGKIIDEALKD